MTIPKEIHTLNDAILAAAKELSTRPKGRRRIIYVVSDGKEYGSKATYRDVLRYLETNDITVYGTLVGDSARWGEGYISRLHLPFTMYDNRLASYTLATGGTLDSERDLNGMETKPIPELPRKRGHGIRWAISATSPVIDGKFRPIDVRVDRPGLEVIAKTGYYPQRARRAVTYFFSQCAGACKSTASPRHAKLLSSLFPPSVSFPLTFIPLRMAACPQPASAPFRIVHTVCSHDCPDSCAVLVTVNEEGRAVKVQGDPSQPVTQGFLCGKVAKYLDRVYAPGRLLYPLKRKAGVAKGPLERGREHEAFERISWDEALEGIAGRLQRISDEYGPESILPYSYAGTIGVLGYGSMDRRFFHRLGASQLDRTICAEAGGVAWNLVYGKKFGTPIEDFRLSKLIVAWGANIHGNNIHLWPMWSRHGGTAHGSL